MGDSEADPFGETRMKPGWLSSRRSRQSWRRAMMRLSTSRLLPLRLSLSLTLSHSRALVLSLDTSPSQYPSFHLPSKVSSSCRLFRV